MPEKPALEPAVTAQSSVMGGMMVLMQEGIMIITVEIKIIVRMADQHL